MKQQNANLTPSGNQIPKRALTKPSIVTVIIFMIIVIAWVPNTLPFFTNMASAQGIIALVLVPLAIVGLFLSFYAGLTFTKITYSMADRRALVISIIALFIFQLICIGECIVFEMIIAGYPFKMCFDYCQQVELPTALCAYAIVTTVMFLPAYFAVGCYNNWFKTYNIKALKAAEQKLHFDK